jgi:hypothetical protein
VPSKKVIFHCTAEPCHSIRVLAWWNGVVCDEALGSEIRFCPSGSFLGHRLLQAELPNRKKRLPRWLRPEWPG